MYRANAFTCVEKVSETPVAVPLHTPGWQLPVPPTVWNVTVHGASTGFGVQFAGPVQVDSANGDDRDWKPDTPAKLIYALANALVLPTDNAHSNAAQNSTFFMFSPRGPILALAGARQVSPNYTYANTACVS